MKLYTEEQVNIAMRLVHTTNQSYMDVLDSLTPIELPSDEEIEKKFTASPDTDMYRVYDNGIKYGAKWMKEQILNQNK